ncbi:hypothetical protein MY3296_004205 [Beauveria thailandica]
MSLLIPRATIGTIKLLTSPSGLAAGQNYQLDQKVVSSPGEFEDGKLPDIILGHGFRWRPKLSRYSWPGLWAMDEGRDGASDVTQLGHSFGSRDAGSLGAPMITTFTSRPKL